MSRSLRNESFGTNPPTSKAPNRPYSGITPYAAIQGQSFHTPGYRDRRHRQWLCTRVRLERRDRYPERVGRALRPGVGDLPKRRAGAVGRVAWAHDWVSDPTLTPLFQTLPGASFIVNGATLAQNSALGSVGGELRFANGIMLLAKFDGEFASHSSTYGGTGTLRYRW